ncbi:hypothetical protein HDU79_008173 [Rhizoclosmatium sp. JEL0117]|nr:hypothetical protein HDU79_008173 [Rhizoclosmatium sp. JEL0117]
MAESTAVDVDTETAAPAWVDGGSIKWIGTAPPQKADAIGSPERWLDGSEDKDSNTAEDGVVSESQIENWLKELEPATLAQDLASLREDMKVLALAITQQRNLRKAEGDEKVADFFSKVAKVPVAELNADEQTEAEKGWPKYMVALKHAETILTAIDTNIVQKQAKFHPEQFLSVLDAQLQISELKVALAQKEQDLTVANEKALALTKEMDESKLQDIVAVKASLSERDQELAATRKELSDAKERILSLTTQLDAANQRITAQEIAKAQLAAGLPSPIARPSTPTGLVSGIIGQLRRSSAMFGTQEQATTVPTLSPVAEKQDKNAVPASVASSSENKTGAQTATTAADSKPETEIVGLPDDPSASLQACGEWFKSAETFDFFISYRVATDARVAMELYFRLKDQRIVDEYGHSRQVKVYWDKECLKKGQDWRDGFVQGLKNSRCVLMIMSVGAAERMKESDKKGDNVLLEWETAILAGKKNICIPQPVFINNPKEGVSALDFYSKFQKTCPATRPDQTDAHRVSCRTTISAATNLQGIQLDVNEISWSIPELIRALQTYNANIVKAAATQCAIEYSFFNHYPRLDIASKAFTIKFLNDYDLKEVFGSDKDQDTQGILKVQQYREKLETLELAFNKSPRMDEYAVQVLCNGLKTNFTFLTSLSLKSVNFREPSTWNYLAEALEQNTCLKELNLSENDICGQTRLHNAIKDHPALNNVLVGPGWDPLLILHGDKIETAFFYACDATGLQLLTEIYEIGKPIIHNIGFWDQNDTMKGASVPKGLGSMLAKIEGLESIRLFTSNSSFMVALVDCVASNVSLTSINVEGQGSDTVDVSLQNANNDKNTDTNARGGTQPKSNKVSKKKEAAAWMKPFCDALIQRHTTSSDLQPTIDPITTLQLKNLKLVDEDYFLLAATVPAVQGTLESLFLDSNDATANGASAIFKAFSFPDAKLSTLTMIDNNVGPLCAPDLSTLMKTLKNITSLDMSENPLGDEAVEQICDGIISNSESKLQILNFRRTNMTGDRGFKAMAKVLEFPNVNLTALDLSENDANSAGVQMIGKALPGSVSTLTSLSLHGLYCGPDGFEAVADAVKNTESVITYLDVSNCKLGDVGAAVLLNSFSENHKFDIYLQENDVRGSKLLLDTLRAKLEANELHHLDLDGNTTLTTEFFKELGQMMKSQGVRYKAQRLKDQEKYWTDYLAEKELKKAAKAAEPAAVDAQSSIAPAAESAVANQSQETPNQENVEATQEPDKTFEDFEAEASNKYPGIVYLTFNGTRCGDEGAIAMLEAMPEWEDFNVSFSNCDLTDATVDAIIEKLKATPVDVRHWGRITLDDNSITNEAAERLLNAAIEFDKLRLKEGETYPNRALTISLNQTQITDIWQAEHSEKIDALQLVPLQRWVYNSEAEYDYGKGYISRAEEENVENTVTENPVTDDNKDESEVEAAVEMSGAEVTTVASQSELVAKEFGQDVTGVEVAAVAPQSESVTKEFGQDV